MAIFPPRPLALHPSFRPPWEFSEEPPALWAFGGLLAGAGLGAALGRIFATSLGVAAFALVFGAGLAHALRLTVRDRRAAAAAARACALEGEEVEVGVIRAAPAGEDERGRWTLVISDGPHPNGARLLEREIRLPGEPLLLPGNGVLALRHPAHPGRYVFPCKRDLSPLQLDAAAIAEAKRAFAELVRLRAAAEAEANRKMLAAYVDAHGD